MGHINMEERVDLIWVVGYHTIENLPDNFMRKRTVSSVVRKRSGAESSDIAMPSFGGQAAIFTYYLCNPPNC